MTTSLKHQDCPQCEIAYINGIRTHEIGCPLDWEGMLKECRWCGSEFEMQERGQLCCDAECLDAYRS